MKLLRKLPSNRTYDEVKNHYLVEKEIAERIMHADKIGRRTIYATMYDELFSKVPDHPRLTIRSNEKLTKKSLKTKYSLVRPFFDLSKTFAEFAPGDCKFSMDVSKYYKHVYGIDISDQRDQNDVVPDNFSLIVYDGYNLDEIDSGSVDIMFSDQLIEHFHPDETKDHFKIVYDKLNNEGNYVFCTPHNYTGPHDVSMYFSYEPVGFHLKEWTYTELKELLEGIGYSKFRTYWFAKGIRMPLPYMYFYITEKVLKIFPKKWIRQIAKYLLPSICIVSTK